MLNQWLLHKAFEDLHNEGLIKEFRLLDSTIANLRLAKHILFCEMTQQEWQTESSTHPGLFTLSQEVRSQISKSASDLFSSLLSFEYCLLDKCDIKQCKDQSELDARCKWRCMRLSMNQINQIRNFFKKRLAGENRAVKSWIEKLEYFNEKEQIFKETAQGVQKFYFFVEAPNVRIPKLQEVKDDATYHIRTMLLESPPMVEFHAYISNHNSIVEILSILRQKIEQQKVYSGHTDTLRYKFLESSILNQFQGLSNEAIMQQLAVIEQQQRAHNQNTLKLYNQDIGKMMRQEVLIS